MKKQLQLFLNDEDERRLSLLLTENLGQIKFINDNVWKAEPDVKAGIEECDLRRVYLFNGEIESLPMFKRKDGNLEGPAAGCVIQILRPTLRNGVLFSGRVAAGFDDEDMEMKSFVSVVWKCIKKLGVIGVLAPSGEINKNYLVGEFAAAEVRKEAMLIADRPTGILFKLRDC